MPVQERNQEPGAYYHVGVRGVRQLPIGFDDRDRAMFQRLFAKTVITFEWRCFVWCLMPNHVHFAIQIAEPNLSNGMYLLNHSFARYLNQRHGYSGHAFDRRFYAGHVKSDPHLLELSRYIVLNPVRAGLCESPEEWAWSSHGAMLGLGRQPFVDTDFLLEQFGPTREQAIENYLEFVGEGLRLGRASVTKA
jgi:REP element-mobilizing transposase RayT